MNRSSIVLIVTAHARIGHGLRAIVRAENPSSPVLMTQDSETARHLLQTTPIKLLIIDATLLEQIAIGDHADHCLALVYTAQHEKLAHQQNVGGVLHTNWTTQRLSAQMWRWISPEAVHGAA